MDLVNDTMSRGRELIKMAVEKISEADQHSISNAPTSDKLDSNRPSPTLNGFNPGYLEVSPQKLNEKDKF